MILDKTNIIKKHHVMDTTTFRITTCVLYDAVILQQNIFHTFKPWDDKMQQ